MSDQQQQQDVYDEHSRSGLASAAGGDVLNNNAQNNNNSNTDKITNPFTLTSESSAEGLEQLTESLDYLVTHFPDELTLGKPAGGAGLGGQYANDNNSSGLNADGSSNNNNNEFDLLSSPALATYLAELRSRKLKSLLPDNKEQSSAEAAADGQGGRVEEEKQQQQQGNSKGQSPTSSKQQTRVGSAGSDSASSTSTSTNNAPTSSSSSAAASSSILTERDDGQRLLREEVQTQLTLFIQQFNELRERNEKLPQIEKLGYADFVIDMALRETLTLESEDKISSVREQIKQENLSKELIIQKIVQQCWNSMEVRGAMLTPFKTTESEVHNFPIRAMTQKEVRIRNKVLFLRKMEYAQKKMYVSQQTGRGEENNNNSNNNDSHNNNNNNGNNNSSVADKQFNPSRLTEESGGYLVNFEQEKGDSSGSGSSSNDATVATVASGVQSKDGEKEKLGGGKGNTKGDLPVSSLNKQTSSAVAASNTSSSSSSSDSPCDNLPRFLLYHPLDVITSFRKRTQAYLLQRKIETIWRGFNDVFNEYHNLKLREIDLIAEKSKRIQEIHNELQIEGVIYKPQLSPDEIPSSVLTVKEEEIKSIKVLSKAERVIAEAKAARDRLNASHTDDGPTRALESMMGGTLDTKRDLSLLEQELVPEEWMRTIPPEQQTEEQRLEVAKFEKRCKIIQAEQETRRKLLQTELSKLKGDVTDIARNFDLKFKLYLYEYRITVQREIYQHELMIIKLLNDILIEEDKIVQEEQCVRKIRLLGSTINLSRGLRTEYERMYRSSQIQYESMQSELKNLDRQFRKDLQHGGGEEWNQAVQQQLMQRQEEIQVQLQQLQEMMQGQQQQNDANKDASEQKEVSPQLNEEESYQQQQHLQQQYQLLQQQLQSSQQGGENLDHLYKLFRARKQARVQKKKSNKIQIDAITGRPVRAGSGLGRLINETAGSGGGGNGGRTGSREGTPGQPSNDGSGGVQSIRRRKSGLGNKGGDGQDGDDGDSNNGASANDPTEHDDLMSHLTALYQQHNSSTNNNSNGNNPPSSQPNPQLLEDIKYLDLDEQDKPDSASLSLDLWYHLLDRREEYIQKERDLRRYHYNLQVMHQYIGTLHELEYSLENELRKNRTVLQTSQESRSIASLNTEIILKIQQGQVEINESPVVTDLKDCEMIDRQEVSRLNQIIKKQGGEKVDILKDTTISRTQINLLEWTRSKLELEHEDSVDLTTELQLLRVTKSLQNLIKMGGHDNQKAAELKSLDRKIEFVSASNRDNQLAKKMKLLKVKKRIKQQQRENERLYETVQELESAVKERMQISSIRDEGRLEESRAAQERMKSLVTRRKLVDLAKLQSEEIKFLRDQVEQLRRRTFASFAIPQVQMNPDERITQQQPQQSLSRAQTSSRAARVQSMMTSTATAGGSTGVVFPSIHKNPSMMSSQPAATRSVTR